MDKKAQVFVYRPENYSGSIAIDATPSKECREYHENAVIQINISKDLAKSLLENKLGDC